MPDTSETKEGACACGAIAFRCETNAASAVHCHCNDCRKATGSAFATIAGVPRTAFTLISGKPKSWVTTGDSGGRVERQFCGSCGSPLFTLADHVPDTIFVKAGAFADPTWLRPSLACWTSRELPWARLPEDLPGTPRNP